MREIEARYADSVVVIGVHSAKFPAERATEAVRQAVRRHDIRHPVVNDHEFRVWQAYACRAWPTLMFVDPRGKVIGRHEGEFEAGQLAPVVDAMLAEFDAAGWLRRGPLAFGADTNNHRVRVVDLEALTVTTLPIDESRRAHEDERGG